MPSKLDGRNEITAERLKNDPDLWKRLTTYAEGSTKMGNLFLDDENPFQKNEKAAMAQVEELAKQGKLFVREYGRSRHFRQVEKDGENFKLGEQKEAKTAGPYDPVLGSLMRYSRWLFKKLGMEKISNWFDEKLHKYDTYRSMKDHYKKEAKSLTKQEKKELKKQRKLEKLRELAEEIRLELEEAEKELNPKEAGKEEPQAKQPEENQNQGLQNEEKQNEGLQNEEKQNEGLQNEENQAEANQNEVNQNEEKQVENKEEKLDLNHIQVEENRFEIGGRQQGFQNMQVQALDHELTPDPLQIQNQQINIEGVQRPQPQFAVQNQNDQIGFQVMGQQNNLQQLEEQKRQLEQLQQQIQQQQNQAKGKVNINGIEVTGNVDEMDPEALKELITFLQGMDAKNNAKANEQNNNPIEQNKGNNQGEMEAPLNEHPVDDAPNIQERPKEVKQLPLNERLALEKASLDAAKDWKSTLAKNLFDLEGTEELKEQYNKHKDNDTIARTSLTGAVVGLFGLPGLTPEQEQSRSQMLKDLLTGKPLTGKAQEINLGMEHFQTAWGANGEASEVLAEMLSRTINSISQEAGAHQNLTASHVMAGRLISEVFQLAQTAGVKLNLNEEQLTMASGALEMAKVAERGLEARQYLGSQQQIDMTDPKTSEAVRDLLTAKGLEYALKRDATTPEIPNNSTQRLMGYGVMDADSLRTMTNNSAVKKQITAETVMEILNSPNGTNARKTGYSVADAFVADGLQKEAQRQSLLEKNVRQDWGRQEEEIQQNDLQNNLQNDNQMQLQQIAM